ncbi:MAG: DNA methyltransferase [Thaumarchaeota archaeon]|nr:DNA methyltransferase [Nitrososphaerota archaeon]MCZ6615727.1 DNA methyltransferase [Nitrososphaerota archaeon]MCZ6724717.1 DNA methyltransferase [Nitrososphaerota archaeon]
MPILNSDGIDGLFLLSGEDSSIPMGELDSLIRIYHPNTELSSVGRRLVIAKNVNSETVDIISRRGAYVYIGGTFVTSIQNNVRVRDIEEVDFRPFIQNGDGFAIRMMGTRDEDVKVKIETIIGSAVTRQLPSLRVTLSNPDVLIWGVEQSKKIYLGCTRNWDRKKGWVQRRARSKPFFHASALYPKFARALVNLTMAREHETILDPFCGTGTILQEASLMNIEAIGIDIDKKMCMGTNRNLKHLDLKRTSIIRSDSTVLPVKSADVIATDLPYGRCSSTKGKTLRTILDSFLRDTCRILPLGRKATLVYPKGIKLILPPELVLTQKHEIFMHTNLTRVVVVLERQ